jgi:hypothetical protein
MSSELLSCFFSECESRFRFLEVEHGFRYVSGLTSYHNGRQVLRPYRGQETPNPFWATTRYEKGNYALEIVYGDSDYSIESYAYINMVNRLHIDELLKAGRKSELLSGNARNVSENISLEKALESLSDMYKNNPACIIDPEQHLIERAITMRGRLLEETIMRHYRDTIEVVSAQGARAYTQKDYERVVELLSPYEQYLTPSDLKKLARAKKKIKKRS